MNLSKRLLGRMEAPHKSLPMAGDRHKQCSFPIHSSDTIQIQHALASQIPESLEYLNLKTLLLMSHFMLA